MSKKHICRQNVYIINIILPVGERCILFIDQYRIFHDVPLCNKKIHHILLCFNTPVTYRCSESDKIKKKYKCFTKCESFFSYTTIIQMYFLGVICVLVIGSYYFKKTIWFCLKCSLFYLCLLAMSVIVVVWSLLTRCGRTTKNYRQETFSFSFSMQNLLNIFSISILKMYF